MGEALDDACRDHRRVGSVAPHTLERRGGSPGRQRPGRSTSRRAPALHRRPPGPCVGCAGPVSVWATMSPMLDEAESFNDPARATKAREEIDFISSELARAFGLGGRDHRAAAHADGARLNVPRAIRAAMRNLARRTLPFGRRLASTIRRGRYCSYTPDSRAGVSWEIDHR
jgi:hypothetical protein